MEILIKVLQILVTVSLKYVTVIRNLVTSKTLL